MHSTEHKKDINTQDLPQEDVFAKKNPSQFPQPADTGSALKVDDKDQEHTPVADKEEEKTSKEEGINEAKSPGNAGAFEGFES